MFQSTIYGDEQLAKKTVFKFRISYTEHPGLFESLTSLKFGWNR